MLASMERALCKASNGKKYKVDTPVGAADFVRVQPDFATRQAETLRQPGLPQADRRVILKNWALLGHHLPDPQREAIEPAEKKTMADVCAEIFARVPRAASFRDLDLLEHDTGEVVVQWSKDRTFVRFALAEGAFFAQQAQIADAAATPSQNFVRQLFCSLINVVLGLLSAKEGLSRLGRSKIAQAAARLLGRHASLDPMAKVLLKLWDSEPRFLRKYFVQDTAIAGALKDAGHRPVRDMIARLMALVEAFAVPTSPDLTYDMSNCRHCHKTADPPRVCGQCKMAYVRPSCGSAAGGGTGRAGVIAQ